MTPEQQNVAIAQACGWTEIVITPNDPMPPKGRECKGANWGKPLPDYTGSLDAMHGAKKALLTTRALCAEFNRWLLVFGGDVATCESERWTWGQSAEVECRALLRTIGKWTEAKQGGLWIEEKEAFERGDAIEFRGKNIAGFWGQWKPAPLPQWHTNGDTEYRVAKKRPA